MRTLSELGNAVATRRKALGLKQLDVAKRAGLTQSALSRFETGRTSEFGSRKLLSLLEVLELEMEFVGQGVSGTLADLRRELSEK